MHVNNYTLPEPAQEILDQCHLVTVSEPAFRMRAMKRWCWDNSLSLVWSKLIDASDSDYSYDHVAGFWFVNAQDATLFTLKFR